MRIRLLAPIFWTAFFVISAEICLEYRASRRGFDTLAFTKSSHPMAALRAHGVQPAFGPTEAFPFRSEILSQDRIAGKIRIWIASASHAEDVRIPVESVFPVLLSERLAVSGTHGEVINGSHAGDTVERNIEVLHTHAAMWRPDVVILYQMANDVAMLSKRQPNALSASGEKTIEPNIFDAVKSWPTRLMERSTAYELLKSNITNRITAQRLLADRLPDSAKEEFARSIQRYVQASRELGITPVLCTFAVAHLDDRTPPQEYSLGMLRHNPHLSTAGWYRVVLEFNDVIRSTAEDENILLIDVAAEMKGYNECFRDLVHFTPIGHERVASIIAEALAANVENQPYWLSEQVGAQ